jgi:hypothetical protein
VKYLTIDSGKDRTNHFRYALERVTIPRYCLHYNPVCTVIPMVTYYQILRFWGESKALAQLYWCSQPLRSMFTLQLLRAYEWFCSKSFSSTTLYLSQFPACRWVAEEGEESLQNTVSMGNSYGGDEWNKKAASTGSVSFNWWCTSYTPTAPLAHWVPIEHGQMRHVEELLQIEIKLNNSNFINKNLLIHTSSIIITNFFRKPANQGKKKKQNLRML